MQVRRLLVLVAVLAGLAGCSDGSSTGSGGPTTDAAAPDPTSPSTTVPSGPLPAYADYESKTHDDPAHWLCRPPDTTDPCDGDLDATVVAADGARRIEPFERAEDPAVDCFYVYPTISNDPTAISDWTPGEGEELFVLQNQALRVQSSCRLFSPLYRQITNGGLAGKATDPDSVNVPYGDVVDAFRTYLAEDNEGRGFVLLGHSQGSVWLTSLLHDVIEPDPDLRARLVGAYLAGTDIRVPPGEVVGATFDEVPLCTEADQVGCVTTWSSFDQGHGPATTATAKGAKACVAPGTVAGRADTLTPYYLAGLGGLIGPGADGAGGGGWVDGDTTPFETPYVAVPGMVTVRCSEGDHEGYLGVTVEPDPADARADALPLYGGRGPDLHLIDVMLAMGDVEASIRAQAATYGAADGG